MADTKISSYPWLCSTLSGYHDDCYSDAQGLVSDQDAAEQDIATEDAYGKYGLKLVYYAVSKDLERDQLFAEDQLRWILRSWYFIGYTNSIPPNVRSYQLQGIWGEDMMTLYVGKGSFKYYSRYGGPDKNTPDVYDTWEPKIDDIIYLPYNGIFYQIRDVKYWDEAFGLKSHTYTLTLKVYKDDKYTIADNPTIPKDDPIWDIAPSAAPAQYQYNDILKLNDIIEEHPNANVYDVEYKPKEKIEEKTTIDPFTGW